VSRFSTAHQHN